ncbi:MAG: histidinol dehydrogenase [Desulfobacterales bacterium]
MKTYSYPSPSAEKRIAGIVNRGFGFKKKDLRYVEGILEDVRKNGDDAVLTYVRRFDSPKLTPETIKVSDAEFASAQKQVDRSFMRALNRAASQIESFHHHQLQKSWIDTRRPGTLLGQVVHPVDSAGIYVPGAKGGKTPLVSSVLMGGIPAKIAGVKRIVLATPPREDGSVNPYLLAAARKVGVESIYKIGSAWAVGAMAYGTQTVPRVDVIVGPGNIYVTLAKKIVSHVVGIDMVAGPSEILILADESARPEFAAADLLSQAEHDVMASAMLVTDSQQVAENVVTATVERMRNLSRKAVAEASFAKFGAVFTVPHMDVAIDLANRIAPEHLELHVRNPFEIVGRIRNAGAVFLGEYTPEPVGDYMAGPNHVLPTSGTARFASALSVDNFIKKTSILHYSREAFFKESEDIRRLAEIEGLDAHAESVNIRLRKGS